MLRLLASVTATCAVLTAPLQSQQDSASMRRAKECPSCASWNAPHAPVSIYGNAYYVGTAGLGSILLASPGGHILIDGGLPESAPVIIANIRKLGFIVEDIRLIVNSHAHFDHAGGIAEIQRASGAQVAASPASARELRRGDNEPDDPQFGIGVPYPPVRDVRIIADGETLRVGELAVTAHFTPGHTPGGTTWTFSSCFKGVCKDIVYADSQTPVSSDTFLFTKNTSYPAVVADFRHSHSVIEALPCDILLTPHPSASMFWERSARRDAGDVNALSTPGACARYAQTAREALAKRIAAEQK